MQQPADHIFQLSMLQHTPATVVLVAISLVVSLYAFFIDSRLYEWLILHPFKLNTNYHYYSLLTNGFLYGDMRYLTASMLVLLCLGMILEVIIGSMFLAAAFLGILLLSNLFIYFRHRKDPKYFKLSASGAIVGIVVCVFVLNPFVRLGIPWLSWSFPASLLGLIYLGILYYIISARVDNVSHEATLAGAVLGLIFAILIHPQWLPFKLI